MWITNGGKANWCVDFWLTFHFLLFCSILTCVIPPPQPKVDAGVSLKICYKSERSLCFIALRFNQWPLCQDKVWESSPKCCAVPKKETERWQDSLQKCLSNFAAIKQNQFRFLFREGQQQYELTRKVLERLMLPATLLCECADPDQLLLILLETSLTFSEDRQHHSPGVCLSFS